MSQHPQDPLDRAVELFGELFELSAEDQDHRLAELTEDSEVISEVRRLLRGDREADPRLEQGAAAQLSSIEGTRLRSGLEAATVDSLSRLAEHRGSFGRYEILDEVARGGQGVVLQIHDDLLDRHLAMKVILGNQTPRISAPPSPRALGRFLDEAHVTGSLDHPGIVPVHDIGLDREGRAYFTMKLVRGKTLETIFDELAAGEGDWSQPRVLGLILRACEAVSYAHDKGVIHRDLKPSNVMVGNHGEVYVMDWGLAQIVGQEDDRDLRVRPDPESTDTTAGGEPLLRTMDGDIVGTPAYMSPEQACGDTDAMGPRSDVYALGAMLYRLLAGHLPYVPPGVRTSNLEVWKRVKLGPPDALSERALDAPSELVAICNKAMCRDPLARYASTTELAKDLAAYVEGRVVRAYEAGAWAEARKWVRRNKALAASLAAVLVVTIVGIVGVGEVRAERRANDRLEEALDTRRERDERVARKIRGEEVLAQRRATLDPTGMGTVVDRVGESRAERMRSIVDELLAPAIPADVDSETISKRVAQATEVAVDGRLGQALELLPEQDGLTLSEQTRAAIALELEFLATRAEALARSGRIDEALVCCERLLELDPTDAQMQLNYGSLLERSGRADEAVLAFGRAQALAPDPIAVSASAATLTRLKRYPEALESYERVIAMEPEKAIHYFNMSLVLQQLNRLEEAVVALQRASELAPTDPNVWRFLANKLLVLKRWEEAEFAYDEVVPLVEGSTLAQCRFERGEARMHQGKLEEAIIDFDAALALLPSLPRAAEYKADCLDSLGRDEEVLLTLRPLLNVAEPKALHWRLQARALQRLKRHAEAIQAFEVVLSIDPQSWEARAERARSLPALGREEEALEDLNDAIELAPENFELRYSRGFIHGTLEQVEPALADYAVAAALARSDHRPHLESGYLLELNGRMDEAVAAFQSALDLSPGHGAAWCALARVQFALGRAEEARSAVDLGLERDPKAYSRRLECGLRCYELGDYEHTCADLAHALPNLPASTEAQLVVRGWRALVPALVQLGRTGEARSLIEAVLQHSQEEDQDSELRAVLMTLSGNLPRPEAGLPR